MEPTTPDNDEQLRAVTTFATDSHAHLHDNITLADQKAGFLFGTATAILAFLHTTGATQRLLNALKGTGPLGLGEVLVGVAILGLVAGAIGALFVVIPRAPTKRNKGIVAAWAVAHYESPQAYADEVFKNDPAALARAKLEYCWVLARISGRKYRYINFALRCSFVGLVAAVAFLAVG